MSVASRPPGAGRFRHEALLYAGGDEFLSATGRFIRDGVEAGEPTLVVVARAKVERLRDELGETGGTVMFADMAGVGANPGRIIPAWRDFVDAHAASGSRLRGIGEPVWAERDPTTLLECQRHEMLLNLAFEAAPSWWLLCPYDTSTLDPAVIAEAERSHPFVSHGGQSRGSSSYRGTGSGATLDAPLDEPAGQVRELSFTWQSLAELRITVSAAAARAGLLSTRVADMVMAANEVATNSLHHGGGSGRLRLWPHNAGLVCEISDAGHIASPLADRQRPGAGPGDSRGLWLVNQLCDLVQLRSSAAGTTIRLHMQRA
ncbi:MAG TPA: sensor histidine kinase [Candidatus Dormibacteraeota bacterium]|nr:sensor histidine kinase [Candidatus Dormibacteraeota bacterium]